MISDIKQTLLHAAANGGHTEAVQYLLEHGANVNAFDGSRFTALMYAVAAPDFKVDIANALLKAGADLRHVGDNGTNLVSIIAQNSATSPEALRWLKEKGLDITKPGATPGLPPIMSAIAQKNVALLKAHIELGVSLNVVDEEKGNNPLVYAIETQESEIVRIVLDGAKKQGVDLVSMKNKADQSAMHVVAGSINYPDAASKFNPQVRKILSEHMKIASMVIEAGADINASDNKGETPLHNAAAKGNELLVPLLLQHGANVNLYNNQGITPYTYATAFAKSKVATMLAAKMTDNALYTRDAAVLPKLDKQNLVASFVENGTKLPVYLLTSSAGDEFRMDSDAAVPTLKDYKAYRNGTLLVVEGESDHHKGTYYSALNTFTHLTGAQRSDAEKSIMAVSQSIEDLGNFNDKVSPASQYSTGYRALIESSKNRDIRNTTYLSASYYRSDKASFRYTPAKEELLKSATQFYSELDMAGIGIASGNDDQKDNATIGKSQPLRANPATMFIGAAEKTADGTYLMKGYSERGAHITAPLPPYYDSRDNTINEGTSFSTPAFNAYRLALFNGTRHLTPREVDAALMITASQNVVDDSENKPYEFASNGTVQYNDKVGVGVADIAKAYKRAQEMDILKKQWVEKKGEDKPIRLQLTADNTVKARQIEVNGAIKYEYSIAIPSDIYIQQLTSNTLTRIGDDKKPMAGESRVIIPSGFTQHARADVYGNASLPAMYGVKLTKDDMVKIVSDQPLINPSLDITGYTPDSFFAMIMQREMATQAASKLKASGVAEVCSDVAAKMYNAQAAACAIAR